MTTDRSYHLKHSAVGAGRHILDTLYIDSLGPFQKIYEVLFKRTISAAQVISRRGMIGLTLKATSLYHQNHE